MLNPGILYNNISASHPSIARGDQALDELRASQSSSRRRDQRPGATNNRVAAQALLPGTGSTLHAAIERESARQTYTAAQRIPPPRRVSSRGSNRSPPPAYRTRAHSEEHLPSYDLPPSCGHTHGLTGVDGDNVVRPRAIPMVAPRRLHHGAVQDVYGVGAPRDVVLERRSSYPRLPRQTTIVPRPRIRGLGGVGVCGSRGCIVLGLLVFVAFITIMSLWVSAAVKAEDGDLPAGTTSTISTTCTLSETVAFTCRNEKAAPMCFGDRLLAFDPAWKTEQWRAFESYGGAIVACKAYMVSKQWMWKCQEAKCTGQDCSTFEAVCVGKSNTEQKSPRERFEHWNEI